MTARDDIETIREKIMLFVPQGFRDEDGIWHDGPHWIEADQALDRLAARLEALETAVRGGRDMRFFFGELAGMCAHPFNVEAITQEWDVPLRILDALDQPGSDGTA